MLGLSTAFLPAATIYSTGFQASEGYNTNLDLVGQNGWRKLGSGGKK